MTVVRNSRGNQYGENQKTNVLIHQQTERCWTNRNAFYQNRKKTKKTKKPKKLIEEEMNLRDRAGYWTSG